jgi:acetyltransferase-like isoleucine patch superfamily enzyme
MPEEYSRKPSKNKVLRFGFARVMPSLFVNLYLMLKYKCMIDPGAKIMFPHNLIIGRGTFIGKCEIICQGPIKIGANCIINNNVTINSKTGYINIGDETSINSFSVIFGNGGVDIGSRCAIAPGVKLINNHEIPTDKNEPYGKPVEKFKKVGNNVWLCANVVVVEGVEIGSYSIIGANSFVNKSIPESVIAAGNPAEVIKER